MLGELQTVKLGDNQIEFAWGLEALDHLTSLDVSNNRITDNIGILGALTQLTELNLSGNNGIAFPDVLQVVQNSPQLMRLGLGGIQIDDYEQLHSALTNHDPMYGSIADNLVELDISATGL
ncbi:MAG: hypothetical protein GY746_11735, partial [Gammaproteobacteria bacterium]|nr:hypothetical protein [Gammaproteobacteria bacterium]